MLNAMQLQQQSQLTLSRIAIDQGFTVSGLISLSGSQAFKVGRML
jgi:chromosome segregation and condensation protein ScpB